MYRRFGIELNTFASGAPIQLKTTRAAFRNSVSNNYFGLGIYTTGSAAIQNTDVNGNTGFGSFIKYTTGTGLLGKIAISNSAFNENGTYGLSIGGKYDTPTQANNASSVTLDRVSVSGNGSYGAVIFNDNNTASVTLRRSSFEGNTGNGLEVDSLGAISVDSIAVTANGGYGARLDNQKMAQTGGVTLKTSYWTSRFLDNTSGAGLVILSNGAVSLAGLEASRNSDHGLSINTNSTLAVKDALLFSNGADGINADAQGTMSLNAISSQGNSQDGAQLVTNAGVIKVQSSAFNGNAVNGLWLDIPTATSYTLINVIKAGNGGLDLKLDITP